MQLLQLCERNHSVDIVDSKLFFLVKLADIILVLLKPFRFVLIRYAFAVAVFVPCLFNFGSYAFAQVDVEPKKSVPVLWVGVGEKGFYFVSYVSAFHIRDSSKFIGESANELRSGLVELLSSQVDQGKAVSDVDSNESRDDGNIRSETCGCDHIAHSEAPRCISSLWFSIFPTLAMFAGVALGAHLRGL